jgi:hypothetical protein
MHASAPDEPLTYRLGRMTDRVEQQQASLPLRRAFACNNGLSNYTDVLEQYGNENHAHCLVPHNARTASGSWKPGKSVGPEWWQPWSQKPTAGQQRPLLCQSTVSCRSPSLIYDAPPKRTTAPWSLHPCSQLAGWVDTWDGKTYGCFSHTYTSCHALGACSHNWQISGGTACRQEPDVCPLGDMETQPGCHPITKNAREQDLSLLCAARRFMANVLRAGLQVQIIALKMQPGM